MINSFNDNKFGMFIHWGFYSQIALQEQVFARYDMRREDYEEYAHTFNPIKYNPAEWVSLAKRVGMRYICFTAKHHDGFCMWNTKYTNYNIMNTPYGKDILKRLADECEKQGMLLSIYYSNPDWHCEYGYNPSSTHQWKTVNTNKPDTEKYRNYIKNQITELMTNYGKIYSLFWDIPPAIDDKSINKMVRMLQPEIYINDRGFDSGDFSTPEREYEQTPDLSRFYKMTEACNSVGEQSWGYRKKEDYHSIRYLTTSIDRIMAMGGSYLLNVGPKADGTIDDKTVKIIKRVGKWYNNTEGCLESTQEDKFDYNIPKHKCITNVKDGKTYFHFYNGIWSSAVSMKNYPSVPKKVRLMNTGESLPFEIELLPEFFDIETGKADGEYLHIYDIPIDDLQSEPIIIEVEWH